MSDSRLSVGPYRVTFDEYRSLSSMAKFGFPVHLYNTMISLLFTVSLQLGFWGLLLAAHAYLIGRPPVIVMVVAIATAGIVAFLVCRAVGLWVMRTYYRRQSVSQSDYTVTLDDATVRYALGSIQVTMPWVAINRVAEKGGCFFLFLDQIAGVVVPRRAFANSSAADAFFAFAKERVEASNRGV